MGCASSKGDIKVARKKKLFSYELKGEWLDAERNQYKEIQNHFKTKGYPELSEENVLNLRNEVALSFSRTTPEQQAIIDQCSKERVEIMNEEQGYENSSLGIYVYKVKGKSDLNRKALIYFRGGGAVLLNAKHHMS